jgi:acetyltransferase EpsM
MKLALFGYGGHAREVAAQIGDQITYFVDDEYASDLLRPISSFDINEFMLMIAVSDTKSRYDIVNRLPSKIKYFTFIHPTALIMDTNISIGEGSFIGAYSILTTNIVLGKHAILNRFNHIGHDSTIGDYFSAMPGAIISGNVNISDMVYIGTNSSIKEKLSICSSTIVGSNSAVVKNIDISGVYAGVPAKYIK